MNGIGEWNASKEDQEPANKLDQNNAQTNKIIYFELDFSENYDVFYLYC